MQLIIDRFEGEFAVCEKPDRTMVNIPRCDLPAGAKPGDVLILENGKYRLDKAETVRRKESIKQMMKDLWKKPGESR